MNYTLIAALDRQGLIGRDGQLPWHMPADLQHFKKHTMSKALLMGRITCESLPRALPGRDNYVLTSQPDYHREGFLIIHTLDQLPTSEAEIMVIGGARIYSLMMPQARRMLITRIHHAFTGDVCFPAWDPEQWRITEQTDHLADSKNPHDYSFITYERII